MFPPAAPFPNLEPAAASGPPPAGHSVLLVEDEDSLGDLLMHLLGRINVRVIHATDGATGLQLFAEHKASISLAFVDCRLPDMDGGELCRRLREMQPRLPLLLTSGRDQRGLVGLFSPGGPAAFLPKPYMPADVMRHVNALLGRAA